jgi:hypothetical protein
MKEFEKLMKKGAAVHNEGLEQIFELLKNKPIEDFMLVTELGTIDFVNTHSFFELDLKIAAEGVKTAFERFEKRRSRKSDNTNLWDDEDEDLLSVSQKEWLMLVDDAIEKTDNINQMVEDLNGVKSRAFIEGSTDDQYIVIVAVEMAKESLSYWEANHLEWEKLLPLFENVPETGSRWFNWREVGKADVAGAVRGAIRGFFASGPAGMLSGAASDALGSSAANAIGQLWDHYTNTNQ